MPAPIPKLATQFSLANYAFAGIVSGRSPFYLPDFTKPTSGVGQVRNTVMEQAPLTEVSFLVGDGKRKVAPLILQGTYIAKTEEEARLWGASLEESLPLWTGIQRSADVIRNLNAGGWVEWPVTDQPFLRPYIITVLPSGPFWVDGTGNSVPF